jgi:hypothetical protein
VKLVNRTTRIVTTGKIMAMAIGEIMITRRRTIGRKTTRGRGSIESQVVCEIMLEPIVE